MAVEVVGRLHPFSATPAGVIDGTNAVFTIALPNNPVQVDVWLNHLINGAGIRDDIRHGNFDDYLRGSTAAGDSLCCARLVLASRFFCLPEPPIL